MNHHASGHARERLAERYGVNMSRSDWQRLAQEIQSYPYVVTGREGTDEMRTAQVPIVLPDGTLVAPMAYRVGRRAGQVTGRAVITTVLPGGYWTNVRSR